MFVLLVNKYERERLNGEIWVQSIHSRVMECSNLCNGESLRKSFPSIDNRVWLVSVNVNHYIGNPQVYACIYTEDTVLVLFTK